MASPVRSVLGLEVLVGVPVRVKYDDGVGRLQIKAETARPRGQEEDEVVRVGSVELGQHVTTVLRFRGTVQPDK